MLQPARTVFEQRKKRHGPRSPLRSPQKLLPAIPPESAHRPPSQSAHVRREFADPSSTPPGPSSSRSAPTPSRQPTTPSTPTSHRRDRRTGRPLAPQTGRRIVVVSSGAIGGRHRPPGRATRNAPRTSAPPGRRVRRTGTYLIRSLRRGPPETRPTRLPDPADGE